MLRTPEPRGGRAYLFCMKSQAWANGFGLWDEAMSFKTREEAEEFLLPMKIINSDDLWQGAHAWEQVVSIVDHV